MRTPRSRAGRPDSLSDARNKRDFLAHRGSRLIGAQALAARGPDWKREIAQARDYLVACQERELAEREEREAAAKRERKSVVRTRRLQVLAFVSAIVIFAGLVGVIKGYVLGQWHW
jgi:hypothetical protein